MSKIDYNELVEFVRTHDEYYVAEFMFADNKRIAELEKDLEFTTKTANELIEIKHKLEKELAELKEKAIVPKFKIGQEIYSVGYLDIQSWVVDRIELGIINGELCEIYRLGHIGTDNYNCCILPQDNEKFFATLEEAQEKLKEIQGNE